MAIDYGMVCHRASDLFEKYWNMDLDEENIDEVIDAFIGSGHDPS